MTERRRITLVVERGSWQAPFAAALAEELQAAHDCRLVESYDAIEESELTFFLGCTRIAGPEILGRSKHNLVVHQSDLPKGRGWSPLAWQVVEGRHEIPVCLFEAVEELDAGPVYLRDVIRLEGHELVDELRAAQAESNRRLILEFLRRYPEVVAEDQVGEPSYFARRTPESSRLDPDRTIAEQFDLLRICDNERYPAFFDYRGRRYKLKIEKSPTAE